MSEPQRGDTEWKLIPYGFYQMFPLELVLLDCFLNAVDHHPKNLRSRLAHPTIL
jgi:hypothetical protein